MHDGQIGGHFGAERTVARLHTRYFWYRMSCASKARPRKTPQAPMGTVRVGAPMERIALDIMGPLNKTDRKNSYVLVILATTAERCHWDWDLMIPFAVRAYRETKHSATGFTPNFMMFGREYQIGDAVWYLIKGTQRVKNKVRKFLPAYEEPYFILGHLDDLVYRIQKGPKTKVKVVHHDQLKPYRCCDPLDNTWVVEHARRWTPTEVSPPTLDMDPADPILGLSQLFTDRDSAAEEDPH
ncbi:hypothetical protein NHX12_024727 [Muraenolepis orangiensis]|uniref:Integrase zinc-binding domain-containing protein n=1 Tax=Muraenolepis orangiensis TaxID=630683 RepID=A0A9Q0ISK8_9TELE|nr:hypothetical protein NHX12_024727 [Muraenolepis orangiensis]